MNFSTITLVPTGLALLLTLACSDPPSPPAQGALTEVISPNATTNGCPGFSPEITAPANADPVSGTSASLNCDLSLNTGCSADSNVVVDGDGSASVSCQVSGGGPFTVSASLSQDLPNGSVSFNIAGTLADNGGTATVSSSHAGYYLQDPKCNITIVPNQGQIKAGAIWAKFDCENFGDPHGSSAPGCAGTGKFIFENCSK